MHPALRHIEHRPWPLPERPWSWRQQWLDLLFLHWPVPLDSLAPLIPRELEIDRFDGQAWVGLVPFVLADFSIRELPAIPWLSRFPEMNLRTYVTDGHKPGIWFFRMDAARAAAVVGARVTLGLPYVWSSMRVTSGARVHYQVRQGGARFRGEYWPVGPVRAASAGTLEHFLTERYCLYSRRGRRLLRLEVHHPPWPLQPAQAAIAENTIAATLGIPAPSSHPILHFARRIDVVGWRPDLLRRSL